MKAACEKRFDFCRSSSVKARMMDCTSVNSSMFAAMVMAETLCALGLIIIGIIMQ